MTNAKKTHVNVKELLKDLKNLEKKLEDSDGFEDKETYFLELKCSELEDELRSIKLTLDERLGF